MLVRGVAATSSRIAAQASAGSAISFHGPILRRGLLAFEETQFGRRGQSRSSAAVGMKAV